MFLLGPFLLFIAGFLLFVNARIWIDASKAFPARLIGIVLVLVFFGVGLVWYLDSALVFRLVSILLVLAPPVRFGILLRSPGVKVKRNAYLFQLLLASLISFFITSVFICTLLERHSRFLNFTGVPSA